MQIITRLAEISPRYDALLCDLWGCLHNGVTAFPEAVAALEGFRAGGGVVILLTNAPRPKADVEAQLARLRVPADAWDDIATSGDAARIALYRGMIGEKIHHIGPEKDLGLFSPPPEVEDPADIRRVPLEEAEGILCTGLVDDRSETPEDYRPTLLMAKQLGLKMLCANPDIVVHYGDTVLYCAGALARLYEEMGGEVLYFGKPWPPVYTLAQNRIAALGREIPDAGILAIGDGIDTDIRGGLGEGFDTLFITGGIAAAETATPSAPDGGPDPARLEALIRKAMIEPTFAMGHLR